MIGQKLTFLSLASLIPQIQAYGQAKPLAFALANGIPVAEDNASYDCHANCGYAILAARQCSPDGKSDEDFDEACLCASNVQFASLVPECLSCGWCLWTDYGKFLTSALDVCDYETTPTGTECITQTSNWYALAGASGEAEATADSEQESAASYYASQYGNGGSGSASVTSSDSVSTASDTVTSGSSSTATRSRSSTGSSVAASSESSASSESASSTATGAGSQYTVGLTSIVLAFGALLI